jgi:hypothetical protein
MALRIDCHPGGFAKMNIVGKLQEIGVSSEGDLWNRLLLCMAAGDQQERYHEERESGQG